MRSILVCFFIVLSHSFVIGQQSAPQLWKQDVGSDTQWIFAAGSNLLVASNERLLIYSDSSFSDTLQTTTIRALDQNTGAEQWSFQPANPSRIDRVEAIQNTSLLIVHGVPVTIIDPSDGRLIIDPSFFTEIFNYGFLDESKHLWVEGIVGNSRTIAMFEMPSSTRLWTKSEYFIEPRNESKKEGKKPAKFKIVLPQEKPVSHTSRMLCNPIADGMGNIIFIAGDGVSSNSIYKISIDNGNLQWKSNAPFVDKNRVFPIETEPAHFKLLAGTNEFYYSREKWITACNYDNGASLWQVPIDIKGKANQVVNNNNEVIISTVVADAATIIPTGYFYSANKSNGVLSQKVSYRLKGTLQNVIPTSKGVLYSTDKSVGLIDANGQELIDIPGNVLGVASGTKLYAFSKQDKNLYEIDRPTGTIKILKSAIDFKSIDNPERMELCDEGIVLLSSQNIAFVNFDGSIRYLNHYSALSDFKTSFFQSVDRTLQLPRASGDNFIVMPSSMDSQSVLVIIEKTSGKEISRVVLPDAQLQPTFATDFNTHRLFYVDKKKKTLAAFDIDKRN